jgi:hypothetical protein
MAARKKKKQKMGNDALAAILAWMKDHERHDDSRFKEGSEHMATLATKEDLAEMMKFFLEEDPEAPGQLRPKFATRRDVEPIIDLYNKLVLSAKITNGVGKFSKWFILTGAALFIALGVLTGGFKSFIVGLAAWATGR